MRSGLTRICGLSLDVTEHVVSGTPVKTVKVKFGTFSYIVVSAGDVSGMLCEFVVDGHLDCSFIIDHDDGWRIWKSQLGPVIVLCS